MKIINILKYLLVIMVLFLLTDNVICAEVIVSNGNIHFKTQDTKATTSIRWRTSGFNIRKEETKGYPMIDDRYARVNLNYVVSIKEMPNGKLETEFCVPSDDIVKACADKKDFYIRNRDIVYLNAYFQVSHSGNVLPTLYHVKSNSVFNGETYPGIQDAESWYNKNDFDDHFDIRVVYEAKSYQVEVEYRTTDNILIGSKDPVIKYEQDEVTEQLPETQNYQRKEYKLVQSYYINMDNQSIKYEEKNVPTSSISQVKNITGIVRDGGLKFVGIYSTDIDVPELVKPVPETMEKTIVPPTVTGEIKADVRENKKFNVTDGIPTTEHLYCNVFGTEYLFGYIFEKKVGTKKYPVKVTKNYELKWEVVEYYTDSSGIRQSETKKYSDTVPVSKVVYVERAYAYWYLKNLEVYGIDNTKLTNYALPNGNITIQPKGYTPPIVNYTNSTNDSDHIIDPKYTEVLPLAKSVVSGNGSRPSVPDESDKFLEEAEKAVPEMYVKNDRLTFNGSVIMSDLQSKKEGLRPVHIPPCTKITGKDVLYERNLFIDTEKKNGSFDSDGKIYYNRYANIKGTTKSTLDYKVEGLEKVVIHTPTVCDVQIEDKKRHNQMLNPDLSVASLILDLNFNIKYPTIGTHRPILGYGTIDYAKYIKKREVRFPFDVYLNGAYIAAKNWTEITNEITQFYLPIWVDEGKYTIEFRSISINAEANSGINKTQEIANLNLEKYTATDTIDVEISGRVYDFNLYDISDYPTWQSVFRLNNTLTHSGVRYTVGVKDQNGGTTMRNAHFTLPLVNGSHSKYKNIGTINTGYITRFSLVTIGNMYSSRDYINIKPTFYYVDINGKNRQEVDLYYSETFDNKKQRLVKAGSELDKLNKKSMILGEPLTSVPEVEIRETAASKGVSEKQLKGVKKNVYTFMNLMIPDSMRTYIGNSVHVPYSLAAKEKKSKQRWYGEYYLPSEVYVTKKGYDVLKYANENGITYKESFWLKNGYIIINLDIETIKNDSRYLSYINQYNNQVNGCCNMWKTEGFAYSKVDYKQVNLQFIDGDYVLYNTDKSAAKDYISGGTH